MINVRCQYECNGCGFDMQGFGRCEPAGMIGASNFFELAVAVAVALFGTSSPAALATTVGVLTEVPVMLTLVKIANKLKEKFKYE
jgi:ACR3 family arsenite transporter